MNSYPKYMQWFLLSLCLAGYFVLPLQAEQKRKSLMQIENPSPEQLQLLPKNLARWHLGAQLLIPKKSGGFEVYKPSQQDEFPAGILLQDDEAAGIFLETGSHNYVIDLGRFHTVGRFSANSFGATGSLVLRTSDTLQDLKNPNWVQLDREVPFKENDIIDLRFPLTDTRYLWIEAKIGQAGELGNLSAMGMLNMTNVDFQARWKNRGSADTDSTDRQQGNITTESTPFDWGSIFSGSRVTHVSAGDSRVANFLIDEDLLTYYDIPKDAGSSIMVFDLQETRDLERISLLLESGAGSVEVYFARKLPFESTPANFDESTTVRFWSHPETGHPLQLAASNQYNFALARQFAQNSRFQTIEVDEDFLNQLEKPSSLSIEAGAGRVQIPIPPTSARFVIIRWIPDVEMPLGLRIFEVSLIGRIPTEEPVVDVISAPDMGAEEFAALSNADQSPVETIPPLETIVPDISDVLTPQVVSP